MSDKGNFIDLLLKHLDSSAIMDLIIKISTQLEGPPLRSNIFSVSIPYHIFSWLIIHNNYNNIIKIVSVI